MTPRPRTRNWVWFYIVLGGLAVAALVIPFIVVPMVHGLVPLTRENLKSARRLWEQSHVFDYDMEYKKKGSVGGDFKVQVRDGKAISVLMDDQPLDRSSNPRLYDYQTMNAMFDDLETLLDLAEKPGAPPVYLRVRFDPVDGHVVRYIYHVTGTPQKMEVSVRLHRLDAAGR